MFEYLYKFEKIKNNKRFVMSIKSHQKRTITDRMIQNKR
jgi:hypothetical protein